jgi:hypothetical protein
MSKQCLCCTDSCESCGKIFEFNNFPKFCSIECAIKCFQPIDKIESELNANKRDYAPYNCKVCKAVYHRREYYYNTIDFCSIDCLLQIIKPQIHDEHNAHNAHNKTKSAKNFNTSHTVSTIFIIISAISLTSISVIYHKQLFDIVKLIKKLKY